jgi:hypothetical protein
MIKQDPTIDYERFVETYNQKGKAEATRLVRDLYDFSIQQMQRRLERQTDYQYDRIRGEYRHRKVSMSPPDKFLSLEELETSRKPVQVPEIESSDLNFDKLVMELIYDRGLELSRYIRINHGTRKVIIDKKSLILDGFQVVEK